MTSRERVAAALDHKEPDRVPLDLGGTHATGIMGVAYNRFRARLGLPPGETRIFDPVQQVARVESDLLDDIGADFLPVGVEPVNWRDAALPDGSPCLLPEMWLPRDDGEGGEIIVNPLNNDVILRRSPESFHFTIVGPLIREIDSPRAVDAYRDFIKIADRPFYYDEKFDSVRARAERLRRETDRSLVMCFSGHIFAGAQYIRGFENFYSDLVLDPGFASHLMGTLTDVFIEEFDEFIAAVGHCIDVVQLADDLGSQRGPQISVEMYRRLVKPHHARLYRHIKSRTDAKIFLHSCGSVHDLIPDLIEIGLDILNPVQVSAEKMDTAALKKEFGSELVFWGGGCDTQKVLPFGTPRQVEDEVKRRIADLAPGGGFVFNQVHNIQCEAPPENIEAMYRAFHENCGY
ncbi:MAG: uroporphyrinogen decarboxylase family protein [bacterium]